MTKAMEAVKNGELGNNRATEEYVPRTTLKDRLAGRVKNGSKSRPDPYLTSSKEDKLISFLVKWAMVKQREEVIDVVRRTVKKRKEKEGKIFEKCQF